MTHRECWNTARRRRATSCALALVALCLSLVSAQPAVAHNVDGKLGIGFEETLTAIGSRQWFTSQGASASLNTQPVPDIPASGLAIRRYVGNLAIEGVVGLVAQWPSDRPVEMATFLSVGALYNVVRAPSVNLAIGIRLMGAVARSNDGAVAGPLRYGLAAEIPIRIEYFFSPNFAIAGAVGPTLAVNSTGRNPLTGNSESLDLALTHGDFSGGIGFSYYFD